MLKKLRPHLTYANVVSSLCLFIVVAGGTAYAADTIGSADIIDESIVSADLKNLGVKRADIGLNSINGARIEDGSVGNPDLGLDAVTGAKVLNSSLTGDDINNFSLKDEDIGQATLVTFSADVGTVSASGCVNRLITGIDVQDDHLLLTPSGDDADPFLVYRAEHDPIHGTTPRLRACNLTNSSRADGTTHFNLLVIDAQ